MCKRFRPGCRLRQRRGEQKVHPVQGTSGRQGGLQLSRTGEPPCSERGAARRYRGRKCAVRPGRTLRQDRAQQHPHACPQQHRILLHPLGKEFRIGRAPCPGQRQPVRDARRGEHNLHRAFPDSLTLTRGDDAGHNRHRKGILLAHPAQCQGLESSARVLRCGSELGPRHGNIRGILMGGLHRERYQGT